MIADKLSSSEVTVLQWYLLCSESYIFANYIIYRCKKKWITKDYSGPF